MVSFLSLYLQVLLLNISCTPSSYVYDSSVSIKVPVFPFHFVPFNSVNGRILKKEDGVMGSLVAFFRNGEVQLYYEPNFLGRRLNNSGISRCVARRCHLRRIEVPKPWRSSSPRKIAASEDIVLISRWGRWRGDRKVVEHSKGNVLRFETSVTSLWQPQIFFGKPSPEIILNSKM